jgi:cytochrome b561
MNDDAQRYNGIAIGFHWTIAVLILGMLALGKYMVSLDEADPVRFVLTQWHKSFGIVAMVLIICRLFWRFTHNPPPPDRLKSWEKWVASTVHLLLYALIFVIPVSGWVMVSASPLELSTMVFDWIPWPHLPPFESLPNKDQAASLSAEIHNIAGNLLILLLIAHIAAALRHYFVLRDSVVSRMSPKLPNGRWVSGFVPLVGATVLVIMALITIGFNIVNSVPMTAGMSRINFSFTVQGQDSSGTFSDSTVELVLGAKNPGGNSLKATVNTATVFTGTSQVDSTLMGSDWFDVKNHTQAVFTSSEIVAIDEERYSVTGMLQIKDTTRKLSFEFRMVGLDDSRMASGNFAIDRLEFGLGSSTQPDEETVGYQVVVYFEFEIQ